MPFDLHDVSGLDFSALARSLMSVIQSKIEIE